MQSILDLVVTVLLGGEVTHCATPLLSLTAFSSLSVVKSPCFAVVSRLQDDDHEHDTAVHRLQWTIALKHNFDNHLSCVPQYVHILCSMKTCRPMYQDCATSYVNCVQPLYKKVYVGPYVQKEDKLGLQS